MHPFRAGRSPLAADCERGSPLNRHESGQEWASNRPQESRGDWMSACLRQNAER